MPRAELRFQENLDGSLLVTVEKAPSDLPRRLDPLHGAPDGGVLAGLAVDPPPDGAVQRAGEALYDWLRGADGSRRLLDVLRTVAAPDPACPLFLDLVAPGPKELPWELLRDPDNGFLALDDRWPVCRRVNPVVEQEPGDRVLDPPLRLAAVLSAAGVDAAGEWRALRRAVAAIDPAVLPVRLLVAVGQPELVARVEADLVELAGAGAPGGDGPGGPGGANGADPSPPGPDGGPGADPPAHGGEAHGGEVVTVSSAADLRRRIVGFRPHLLHLFCHGTADHGGLLHLARPSDFVTGDLVGGVTLGREDFEVLARGTDAWMVSLNACDSGRPAGTHALTERIAEAGFPAVIGMRETVRSGDAHVFAGALYGGLLDRLEGWAGGPDDGGDGDDRGDGAAPGLRDLDFASLLLEPRRALAERHAAGRPFQEAAAHRKEWSLPVLFVRPEPLRLAVARGDAGRPPAAGAREDLVRLRAKLETLLELHRGLSALPVPPADTLARLGAEIARLTDELLAA